MSILRIAVYHNTTPPHNKQYSIIIEEYDNQPGIYKVTGRWGKIGYDPQGSKVYAQNTTSAAAQSRFQGMERERFDKGYRKISDTGNALRPVTFGTLVGTLQKTKITKQEKPKSLKPGAGRQVESDE